MPKIHPEDLNPADLQLQLELATGALRYAANYQHHHGKLPGSALQELDYIRDYSKRLINANGPSELTEISVDIKAAKRRGPRSRVERPARP